MKESRTAERQARAPVKTVSGTTRARRTPPQLHLHLVLPPLPDSEETKQAAAALKVHHPPRVIPDGISSRSERVHMAAKVIRNQFVLAGTVAKIVRLTHQRDTRIQDSISAAFRMVAR